MENAVFILAKENDLLRPPDPEATDFISWAHEMNASPRGDTDTSHPRLDVQTPKRPEKFVKQVEELAPVMQDDDEPEVILHVNGENGECPPSGYVNGENGECPPSGSEDEDEPPSTAEKSSWRRMVNAPNWSDDASHVSPGMSGLSGMADIDAEDSWFHFELRQEWQLEDHAIERIKTMHRKKAPQAPQVVDAKAPSPDDQSFETIFVAKARRTSFLDITEIQQFQGFSAMLSKFVLDPASVWRTYWECFGMLLILYDLVVIPLDAFDLPETLFSKGMNLVIVFYWTTDMLMSFFIGYYAGANLVTLPSKVVKRYLRTWFAFDVITVVPEWASLLDLGGSFSLLSSVSIIRSLRVLRFLRLLRILKMEGGYRRMQERINSNIALMISGIIKLVLWLVTVNHFLGCFWYALGKATDDGWASQPEFADESTLYRYLTSIHWSLSQIHGEHLLKIHNTWERATAVLILFMALCLFSLFVSAITDLMFQLSQHTREKSTKMQALNNFFAEYRIDKELAVKAKKELEELIEVRECYRNDVSLTEILPPRLMMDLHFEARGPALAVHPLFAYLRVEYSSVLRQMCHSAVQQVVARQSETIFHTGDACCRMYCIERGRMNYSRQWAITSHGLADVVDHDQLVRGGHIACEAALWVKWETNGQLIAETDTRLLALDASAFGQVIREHSKAHAEAVVYARAFVAALKKQESLSDIMMDMRLHWRPWRKLSAKELSDLKDAGRCSSLWEAMASSPRSASSQSPRALYDDPAAGESFGRRFSD